MCHCIRDLCLHFVPSALAPHISQWCLLSLVPASLSPTYSVNHRVSVKVDYPIVCMRKGMSSVVIIVASTKSPNLKI